MARGARPKTGDFTGASRNLCCRFTRACPVTAEKIATKSGGRSTRNTPWDGNRTGPRRGNCLETKKKAEQGVENPALYQKHGDQLLLGENDSWSEHYAAKMKLDYAALVTG